MSEKVGEMARESANYRCERCHTVTPMTRGALIQPVPIAAMTPTTSPIRALSARTARWARTNRVEAAIGALEFRRGRYKAAYLILSRHDQAARRP